MPFVLEPDGNPVPIERPEILAEDVVELVAPLAREERNDLVTPADELIPVPPDGVRRVRAGNSFGVASVPGFLGSAHLLQRGAGVEGWDRRAYLGQRGLLVRM